MLGIYDPDITRLFTEVTEVPLRSSCLHNEMMIGKVKQVLRNSKIASADTDRKFFREVRDSLAATYINLADLQPGLRQFTKCDYRDGNNATAVSIQSVCVPGAALLRLYVEVRNGSNTLPIRTEVAHRLILQQDKMPLNFAMMASLTTFVGDYLDFPELQFAAGRIDIMRGWSYEFFREYCKWVHHYYVKGDYGK